MSATQVLLSLTAALEKSGIGYMLTGSFASAYYGASRSTQDIDFVIEASPEQLRAFLEDLGGTHYYADLDAAIQALHKRSLFNVIELSSGWKVDLIILKARPFSKEEFSRRKRIDLNDVPLFVASAEDIIIAKMEWSKMSTSIRQLEDAAAIVRTHGEALDQAYLEKWILALQLQSQWEEVRKLAGISK